MDIVNICVSELVLTLSCRHPASVSHRVFILSGLINEVGQRKGEWTGLLPKHNRPRPDCCWDTHTLAILFWLLAKWMVQQVIMWGTGVSSIIYGCTQRSYSQKSACIPPSPNSPQRGRNGDAGRHRASQVSAAWQLRSIQRALCVWRGSRSVSVLGPKSVQSRLASRGETVTLASSITCVVSRFSPWCLEVSLS